MSKNLEVAQWASRVIAKLAFDFPDYNLLQNGWDWFVGEGQGLHISLLGLKRHPDLKE